MVTKTSADVDLDTLLNCALVHKADHLRTFLEQVGLVRSGTKEVLKDRLRSYLEQDSKNALQLTEYLNLIEGWGNQHLYLFNAPSGISKNWRDLQYVEQVLRKNGAVSILNRARPVVLPESPTLASIEWTPQRVRFVWNEKREWLDRREDRDIDSPEEAMVFRAWQLRSARGTLAFDWDLQSGEVMLMIQRLPSGTQYSKIRDDVKSWLRRFIDLDAFDVVRVSLAIKPLLGSGEVRDRRTRWETIQGGKATFTSPGMNKAISADETLRRMEAAGRDDIQGSLGNMYWLSKPASGLNDEFHTTLHRRDQRIGVMGEKHEREVRYVVGRIRAHC